VATLQSHGTQTNIRGQGRHRASGGLFDEAHGAACAAV